VHARVVHFAGTGEGLERGIAAYREQVLPYVREVTGFRGHTLLVDRGSGRALSITFWADEDTLLEYEATAERFRTLLAETWRTPVTDLESYEVALLDFAGT
jgi:heme-degrading monooxygenase HmoA